MKGYRLLTLGIIILTGTTLSTNSVKADEVNKAISKSYINFIADNGPTDPIDPINPDNSNPPKPIDSEDSDNKGTGNSGGLTLDYVSNIQFGTKKIVNGNTIYHAKNKNPFLQVSDKRGTEEGWTLKARASELKSEDGKVLTGAILSLRNGQVKSRSSNVSTPPITNDVVFDNNDAKLVMFTEVDTGRGTWINVFSGTDGDNSNAQLKVLGDSADTLTNYSTVITWELSNAPS
ncbi:cell surface protein [Bacillus cereus]|nr:cell surface protein [Bacillus cereus]PGU68296.1 cell surface protein [Bacillus cereus]